ncbi:Xylulose kinase [Bhargavaea cecembensis DSE10]|uniref:Xylulose kinase n=1 Tax=Bhargavaea cecembensis DSE10 TaxID=1235279 RepID=M7NEN5_9BACL|nr:FGGY-family carbohydrate kinase [Bhargavaea cecembensis]EMR07028.1 Xylulose kinase [Bhargavaea cecembensis DSE10]
MSYLIGVDIGTQGTKAVLVDEKGTVLAHSYKGYEVETPHHSWAEQWPDVWEQAAYETISRVVAESGTDPKNIKGIAVSSLYGGSGIPVNDRMEPVGPCIIWMDRRAEAETEWVRENIDQDELFAVTGNSVNSYFGFTKILWYKNNRPDIWNKISHFVPPCSYVVHKLTNTLAVDYSSAGNIGGVFDIRKKNWSVDLMEKMGIPPSFMPELLVASTEVAGHVTEEAAKRTGLAAGTPVVIGGVDAPVATLGAGALEEGNHVAMLGTSMCWGFVTDRANLSPDLVSMPHVLNPEEKIYTFGGASTAGAIASWFKNTLGQSEMMAAELTGINPYTLLDTEAINVPAGSNGLLVLPYFMGERSPIWDSDARGAVIGLTLLHTKADLYKAFMESVAYALRHNMEEVHGTGVLLDRELTIVGGVSKSLVWPQIIADVTGRPVRVIKDDVEAPLADALLAGIATRTLTGANAVSDWLEFGPVIEPDSANHTVYNEYYRQYLNLYQNLKGSLHDIAELQRTGR